MQQELEKVRSQPPAGSSSTQQQTSNIRLDMLQNDLIQLETIVNKIKEGFSDDFINQGTSQTAQGLDRNNYRINMLSYHLNIYKWKRGHMHRRFKVCV